MKTLHRIKALAAYEGARVVLKAEMVYPAYMMLKEAARGVLSYIVEDQLEQDISDKTKISRLLDLIDIKVISEKDFNILNSLVEAENKGLDAITSMDVAELKEIKHTIKSLISEFMREHV